MEDVNIVHGQNIVQTCDFEAFVVGRRITAGGHNHTDGRFLMPLKRVLLKIAAGARLQHRHNVRLHAHQQRLGFRVSEARIELDDPRLAVLDHQADIEDAAVGAAFAGHAGNRRLDDRLDNFIMQSRRYHRSR